MSEHFVVIHDRASRGVRADRVEGWEWGQGGARTRVSLAGGGQVDLDIPLHEFAQRLERALTAIATGDFGEAS